jgi:glycosyltransferase involved in cell wall biosynthesis
MTDPLVSIILVSHNQGDFVKEAIDSALNQTHPKVELLVVDDGSQDHTPDQINSIAEEVIKILIPQPIGYCKAFNRGFAESKGKYIIDLSGDDILMPDRVAQGVASLKATGAGINFCDAYYIDAKGAVMGTHYQRDSKKQLLDQVVSGDVFRAILERYYICTPTMMIDRQVLEYLGGYDESLYYEDFDFWVRSSRYFQYDFTDALLVKKRVHDLSMSKFQYLPQSKMLDSTLQVCQKAFSLCHSGEEFESLAVRLKYELRQAVISNNYETARGFNDLLSKVQPDSVKGQLWSVLIRLGWDFSFLTQFMGKAR